MVKIVEKNLEEREEEKRASKLFEIATEIIPKEYKIKLVQSRTIGIISGEELGITIRSNNMFVYREKDFDLAMKLAQEYESRGEPEFTIKKQY